MWPVYRALLNTDPIHGAAADPLISSVTYADSVSNAATSPSARHYHLARTYFALQAVAATGWWLALIFSPEVREATLGGLNPAVVALFDLPLFVVTSAIAAAGYVPVIWVLSPYTAIAALGTTGYALATTRAGWGSLIMLLAMAGTIASGMVLRYRRVPGELLLRGPFTFRKAPIATTRAHLLRTLRQMAIFWIVFLALIPAMIWYYEHRLALGAPWHSAVAGFGYGLLILGSVAAIWSAATMSRLGDGTPLPSAMPTRLVIAGPYRWIRNPMAAASITQGIAVGLIVGSWLTVIYALAGAAVWNWAIRPVEENDLHERFGASFHSYQEHVACWIPRLTPYRQD
ncbi:isoprenylcysteine carboxylmethyltransferase family protein [Glutamicibacter endophyticus]